MSTLVVFFPLPQWDHYVHHTETAQIHYSILFNKILNYGYKKHFLLLSPLTSSEKALLEKMYFLALLAGTTGYSFGFWVPTVLSTWIILLISLSIWKLGSEFNIFLKGDFADFLKEGTIGLLWAGLTTISRLMLCMSARTCQSCC